MNSYGDNLYEQSPLIPFSVFGHPLFLGGFSGLRGTIGDKDMDPLRVVVTNGREWGSECSRVIVEVEEVLGVAGQSKEEV